MGTPLCLGSQVVVTYLDSLFLPLPNHVNVSINGNSSVCHIADTYYTYGQFFKKMTASAGLLSELSFLKLGLPFGHNCLFPWRLGFFYSFLNRLTPHCLLHSLLYLKCITEYLVGSCLCKLLRELNSFSGHGDRIYSVREVLVTGTTSTAEKQKF